MSPDIECISEMINVTKLPFKVNVSLPTSIPKPLDHENLPNFFGQIISASTATQEHIYLQELLDEPVLVKKIQTRYEYLSNITCLNGEQIWTSGETSNIQCLTTERSRLKTIQTKSKPCPSDKVVDSDGYLLYSDWTMKTVYKVKNERTEELIRFQGLVSNNSCVTSAGDLLLTLYSDDHTVYKVVPYSGSTEKRIIQFDDVGKSLYSENSSIKYITESREDDISVADWKVRVVVVVDQVGKHWASLNYKEQTI